MNNNNQRAKKIYFVILSVLSGALATLFAFVLSNLLDSAVRKDWNYFLKSAVFGICFVIISVSLEYCQYNLKNKLIKEKTLKLREALFHKIFMKTTNIFYSENESVYFNMLMGNIAKFRELYLETLYKLPYVITSFIIAVVGTLYIDIRLFFILLLICFITVLISRKMAFALKKTNQKWIQSEEQFIFFLKEKLDGFVLIKSYGINAKVEGLFLEKNETFENCFFENKRAMLRSQYVSMFIGLFSTVSIMIISSGFAIKGVISIGMVLAVSQLFGKMLNPIASIAPMVSSYRAGKDIKYKFDEQLNENMINKDLVEQIKLKKQINLEKVSFYYGDKLVLKDFTYTFYKAKKYLIKGPIGSGKSTLIKLIARIQDVYEGSIYYDNLNYHKLTQENLMEDISYVPQETFILEDTLYNNITLYRKYPKNDFERITKGLGLDTFSKKLSKGYQTLLKEKGKNLSGGEKQRIGLARALIRNTNVLLLDEIFSNIDSENIKMMEKEIFKIKNKLVIIVSHQISDELLLNMDEIINLEDLGD